MNVVFTKRDNESVILHYENLQFECYKKYDWNGHGDWSWNRDIHLFAHDQQTAEHLNCRVGDKTGHISGLSYQQIEFFFSSGDSAHRQNCLFCYQTSCMPWLADILKVIYNI